MDITLPCSPDCEHLGQDGEREATECKTCDANKDEFCENLPCASCWKMASCPELSDRRVTIPVYVAVLMSEMMLEGLSAHMDEKRMREAVEEHTGLPFDKVGEYQSGGWKEREVIEMEHPDFRSGDVEDTKWDELQLEISGPLAELVFAVRGALAHADTTGKTFKGESDLRKAMLALFPEKG